MSACAYCHYDAEAKVTARWERRIDVLAVSQNVLSRQGTGRWQYGKFKKQVMKALTAALADGDATVACWFRAGRAKRRVMLTRYWPKRQRAYDRINLAGGMKPVLDCLVELGLLVDDSERWCEDHYAQEGPSECPGIGVVVEEVG